MSDPVDPTPDPTPELDSGMDPELDVDLDPDQARIRALLAEHGSAAAPGAPEPMPAEVVARLEDAVALLAAERAQDVVPLAPRRARRWAPRGLVAAAAVVVIGLGGAAVGGLGGFPGLSGSDEAGVQSGSSGDGGLAESGIAPQDDNGGAAVPGTEDRVGTSTLALPSLSSATFGREARALVASGTLGAGASPRRSAAEAGSPSASPDPSSSPSPTAGSSEEPSKDSSAGSPAESSAPGVDGTGCTGPDLGADGDAEGTTVTPVLLDGRLTALVVRPPRSGTRLVEAWSCDGETRLATARVAP